MWGQPWCQAVETHHDFHALFEYPRQRQLSHVVEVSEKSRDEQSGAARAVEALVVRILLRIAGPDIGSPDPATLASTERHQVTIQGHCPLGAHPLAASSTSTVQTRRPAAFYVTSFYLGFKCPSLEIRRSYQTFGTERYCRVWLAKQSATPQTRKGADPVTLSVSSSG